jgi:type IV pilus biogenesis protein PilP
MRNNRVIRLLVLAGCAAVLLPVERAHAESTASMLARLEAETLVLKAREKQLAVQAQIAARQAELAAQQATVNSRIGVTSAGDPIVQAIEGIGRTLYATLQLDHGNTIEVKAGDILPNGMRIVSILPGEVVVESRQRGKIRLDTGVKREPNMAVGSLRGSLPPPVPPFPARESMR